MLVKDLVAWLNELPQDEEVKYERRPGGTIVLKIPDPEDPQDDYESVIIDSK